MSASLSPEATRLHRAALGRADLLRLLHTLGRDNVAEAALLCGFEAVVVKPAAPEQVNFKPLPPDPTPTPADPTPSPRLHATLYAVVNQQSVPSPDDPSDLSQDDGSIFEQVPQSDGSRAPMPQPLVPAGRMANHVRHCLRRPGPSCVIDVERWVALMALAQFPERLPTRRLPSWRQESALVIDGDDALEPLNHDLQTLVAQVLRWSGASVHVFWYAPRAGWWRAEAGVSELVWRRASLAQCLAQRHWLLVGGIGDGPSTLNWPKLARALFAAGGSLHWLRPQGRAVADSEWPPATRYATWDHGASLRPQRLPSAAEHVPVHTTAFAIEDLLLAMALAVRIEPALLRALRLYLGLAIDAETEVWRHADINSCALGCEIRPTRVMHYRSLLLSKPLAWRRRVVALIATYHRHLSPLIQHEEASIAATFAKGWCAADVASNECVVSTAQWWSQAARTLRQAPRSQAAAELASYVRRVAHRAHPELWASEPGLAEAWLRAEEEAVRDSRELPPGIPLTLVRRVLEAGGTKGDQQAWQLVQQGCMLRLEPQTAGTRQHVLSLLNPLRPRAGVVVNTDGMDRWFALNEAGVDIARLTGLGSWELQADGHEVTVEAIQRPTWAREWGRDAHGLYGLAFAPWGKPIKLYWQPYPQQPRYVARHPALHFEAGESNCIVEADHYGLYAQVSIKGATQRLRWLEPGSFWMGSPEGEAGRSEGEGPRHPVTLTQGLWMADTACTQALWQAVMGNNPSHFKDDEQCPVEQVSWQDVQKFLQRLQALLPGCETQLPTEAQWEYACRAGTCAPFGFGEQITPEQVNYNGKHPYAGGKKGLYREKTVPVKSLPANDWGMYEMHGNVWEWCADGMREYDKAEQQDPLGPMGSDVGWRRVVRGGSWIGYAGSARSAYRDGGPPSYSRGGIGFRWCLRSTGTGPGREVLEGRDGPGLPGGQAFSAPEGRTREIGLLSSALSRVKSVVKPVDKGPKPPRKKK